MVATSPPDLLAHLLVAEGYGSLPPLSNNAPATRYTVFVDSFPDDPTLVLCCLTNGLNRNEGRLLNGCLVDHPGIQIRVRARNRNDAYSKAKTVYDYLSTVRRESITVDTETYRIDNVSVQSEPMYAGTGTDDQFPSFVFDVYLTYVKTGG